MKNLLFNYKLQRKLFGKRETQSGAMWPMFADEKQIENTFSDLMVRNLYDLFKQERCRHMSRCCGLICVTFPHIFDLSRNV
jgi:hypothetical protein